VEQCGTVVLDEDFAGQGLEGCRNKLQRKKLARGGETAVKRRRKK